MIISVKAGALYFALIFVVGFALGTVRVLILTPRFGELYGGLIELPIILAISWFTCLWLIERYKVPASFHSRLSMGATAFILLMIAELGLSIVLFGRSAGEHISSYASFETALGLAGQLLFAAFPLIAAYRSRT